MIRNTYTLKAKNPVKNTSDPDLPICCSQCGLKITEPVKQIRINGRHCHNFTNPEGLVYEIGCFHDAEGCLYTGIPTDEFTWFKGFRWQIAICRQCTTHLGWLFVRSSPHTLTGKSFNGLILKKLTFPDRKG
jgi:hypothetical protein